MADLEARLAIGERGIEACLSFDRLLALRHDSTVPPTVATFYGEISLASMQEVLRRMGVGQRDTLLDFGCGSGRWMLAAHAAGARHVVGVEYCADRAQVACQATAGLEGLTVVPGDGLAPHGVWMHKPTHVVAYNLASPPSIQRAFWERVRNEASVQCVAVWRLAPEDAALFTLVETVQTLTPVGERYTAYLYRRK